MITEDIPGRAEMNPSIVLRNRGAKDKARKTEKPSEEGTSEIAITKKWNKFHGSLKKRSPLENSFNINSITKIAKQILSIIDKTVPCLFIINGEVSIPSMTAFRIIMVKMEYRTFAELSHS